MIDTIKLVGAYGTASVLAIGGLIVLIVAWMQPIDPAGSRDLAVLYGLIGTIIGNATGFLFNQEVAKSATRAAQASSAAGSAQSGGPLQPS